ncbi:MAG: aminopeptidase P family protein [Anaerolineae bacterium]|nr:aminopeptidase P family protein [Anaerolineae bacterium]
MSQSEGIIAETDFPAGEFVRRRARVCRALGDAYALVAGAGPVRGFVALRQTNEFFYLAGIETSQAYLLIDGSAGTGALYLPPRGKAQIGEGAPPGLEDVDWVKAISGVDAVYPVSVLAEHLSQAKVVYTPHTPGEVRATCRYELEAANRAIACDPWDGRPSREHQLIALLHSRFPGIEIKDLTPVLDELRSVKSQSEIAVLRRAGRLSAQAVRVAMRVTRPGLMEYQLGALANYLYAINGAQGEGYRPIVATGENIWYGHYFRLDAPLKAGDLVLMDVAPECNHYTSDVGRMWPVDGTYHPWQQELYGYIVAYHKALLARIRPGVTPEAVMDEAAAAMRKIWEGWAFSKETYREGARKTLAFRGHLSHPVGMAVHDDGSYLGRPLVPGTVFAVDPQMWIPEEKLYIRVEDTVVVREDGIENLTAAAPLALDDVERLMREETMDLPLLGA